MKYRCKICGYIFDEEVEKKNWTEVPDSYVCPMCFVGKAMFAEYKNEETQQTLSLIHILQTQSIYIKMNSQKFQEMN